MRGIEVYEKEMCIVPVSLPLMPLANRCELTLLRHGIKVTNIEPGAAETEFGIVRFKETKQRQSKYTMALFLYLQMMSLKLFITPPHCLHHVCINELVVTCTQQANAIYFNRK